MHAERYSPYPDLIVNAPQIGMMGERSVIQPVSYIKVAIRSFLLVLVALTFVVPACSKRILLLPCSVVSHGRQMMLIGDALVDSGHEVYAAFSQKFHGLSDFKDSQVKLLLHSNTYDDLTTVPLERVIKVIMEMTEKNNFVSTTRESSSEWGNMCVNQLVDDAHYKTLKQLNFDMAIVDVFPFSRCLLPIPYSLGIPYIGLETQYEPWMMGTPTLPSFVPSNNLQGAYTPRMNFWERMHNLWLHIDWFGFPGVTYLSDDFVNKYIREDRPYITMNQLFAGCSLFLTDVDDVLDYPRPRMPNEIPVGGLTTKPAKPLPTDLQEFMASAGSEGVIIFSFGSYTQDFNDEIVQKFVSAFKQVTQKVVWKYLKEPIGLSKNVKVLPWLPQNDLLGHPNTKIFITHCGNNGQFEGLYHGVPMIGLPLYGDQAYNCKRLNYHGFGHCLDLTNFETSHLVNAIQEISANNSHRHNLQLASEIFHSRPMRPNERAVFWVEHVMNFGTRHLRSHGLDLPWYKYWMMDILAFVFGVVLMMLCVFAKVYFLVKNLIKSDGHRKID